jgi:hypothetical protein
MPRGVRLTIKTDNISYLQGLTGGYYVMVETADTSTGVPEAIASKI